MFSICGLSIDESQLQNAGKLDLGVSREFGTNSPALSPGFSHWEITLSRIIVFLIIEELCPSSDSWSIYSEAEELPD